MTTLLVDSHCHLNFDPLQQRLADVLNNAREQGIGHMLCVGVSADKLPEVIGLAHSHDNIFASVGVHPDDQSGNDLATEEIIRLADDARVVAIGETGLDYYRITGDVSWQQDRFRQHIRAAKLSRKPLIIHTREAAGDTLNILREEGADQVGGVMHCFTESWDTAKAALDLGFYISFSGIVTFKTADALRAVAKKVPDDRILIETDAPYLAPVPYRGKPNEPAYLKATALFLADLRHSSFEDLSFHTTRNFFNLFSAAVKAR